MNGEALLHRPGAQQRPSGTQQSRTRLLYIDNLRWTMIILVITMHAADTYSPLGNWYFVDRHPLSTAELLTFAAWQTYLQSFFMALLFFISGLFVPSSFDRKGALRFIGDRAFRLGLPVLLYMFCIGPVTEYYFAHSWTSTAARSFANEWIKHIRKGQFLQENGPLWFCLALLIFSTAYAWIRTLRSGAATEIVKGRKPGTGKLIAFAAVMAAFTFLVRTAKLSPLLNMRLGDFPPYILLFSGGIIAARRRWLPELSFETGMRWIGVVLPAGFAGWLTLVIFGGALSGRGAEYSGGWHWQSAFFCLWESFTCVALCFGLLTLFREKLNSQGRVATFLSKNAFGVYVFHPPIVIAAARVLSSVSWGPLIKFVALAAIASVLSFLFTAAFFRRIPMVRRII